MNEIQQISMVKGEHRFLFNYVRGEEHLAIDQFMKLARQDDSGFDWYDAGVMSYQLGRRLIATKNAE